MAKWTSTAAAGSIPVDPSAAPHSGPGPDEDVAILGAHEGILLVHAGRRVALLQSRNAECVFNRRCFQQKVIPLPIHLSWRLNTLLKLMHEWTRPPTLSTMTSHQGFAAE